MNPDPISPCPHFSPFNPHAPVHIYRRALPHWRQKGATYFVTFRLADSIPKPVLLAWREADRLWLEANGIHGPLSDPRWADAYSQITQPRRAAFERSTAHRMHQELDESYGSCLFRGGAARTTLAAAMFHFHGTRLWLGDFSVMPNHTHALIQPIGTHKLEQLLGSIKRYTSARIRASQNRSGRLWQQDNYDRLVRDREELRIWRNYIRDNPARARAAIATLVR